MSNRQGIIIYWSEDDSTFAAGVPELAGCMADGKSCQEAPTSAEIVIQEWIDTAREIGRPVLEPKERLMYA